MLRSSSSSSREANGAPHSATMNIALLAESYQTVIQESYEEHGQYVSNIFIRLKRNGSPRLIHNLKVLNQDVDYHYFKMDTVHTCVDLLT